MVLPCQGPIVGVMHHVSRTTQSGTPKPESVLTIGSFDGVHLGHAALIHRARTLADAHSAQLNVVALVFDPHPKAVLESDAVPARLSTWDQKAQWLNAAGADDVIRLTPDRALLKQSPEEFIDQLCAQYAPVAFVEGDDFRFGHMRSGDITTLAALGAAHGIAIDVVPPVEAVLADQSIVRVSSTIARWLLQHGRVEDAARVLGRPYELCGTVVRGERRGRELGYPTANIDTTCLLPSDGVYAGIALLPDGTERASAIHVGPRATFDSSQRTLEAYVLDWDGPLPDGSEYGWTINLRITAFLRDQVRFDSIQSLVEQIERDVTRTRDRVGQHIPQGVSI